MYDVANRELHTEVLYPVYYLPTQPFNLMSVRCMIKYNGFDSPNFKELTWSKYDPKARITRTFQFNEKRGAYHWQSLQSSDSPLHLGALQSNSTHASDIFAGYKLDQAEITRLASLYGNVTQCVFDEDISDFDRSKLVPWAGKKYFCLPIFDNKNRADFVSTEKITTRQLRVSTEDNVLGDPLSRGPKYMSKFYEEARKMGATSFVRMDVPPMILSLLTVLASLHPAVLQEEYDSRMDRNSKPSRSRRSPSPGQPISQASRSSTVGALGITRTNWRYVASFAGLDSMLEVAPRLDWT